MIDVNAQAAAIEAQNTQRRLDYNRAVGMNALAKMYGPTAFVPAETSQNIANAQANAMNPMAVQQQQLALGITPQAQPAPAAPAPAAPAPAAPAPAAPAPAAPAQSQAFSAILGSLGAQVQSGVDPSVAFDKATPALSATTGVPVEKLYSYKAGFVADPLGTVTRLQTQISAPQAPYSVPLSNIQDTAGTITQTPVPGGYGPPATMPGAAPSPAPVLPGAEAAPIMGGPAPQDNTGQYNHDGTAKPGLVIPAAPKPVPAPAAPADAPKPMSAADMDKLYKKRDAQVRLTEPMAFTLKPGGAFDLALAAVDSLPESPAMGRFQNWVGFGPAEQFTNLTSAITSIMTLDTLRSLKESGATLGQVSNFENQMMASTGGSLDPATNKDVLRQNLINMRGMFTDIQNTSKENVARANAEIDAATGTKTPKVISPEDLKNPNYEIVPGQTISQAIAQAKQAMALDPNNKAAIIALAQAAGLPPELIFGGN